MTATLLNKKNYVVHYSTLKTYLELGLKIQKINKILGFEQTCFLKPYIDFCTQKRVDSKTEFKKRLWKLFINSVFGKFIESVRKYQKCDIVTSAKRFERSVSCPFFESAIIINENCVVILKRLKKITLNKPIAIGFTILDRSKDFMYDAFYNKITPNFEHCKVIFSDTDSLCMEIQTNSKKSPLLKLKDIMDFSNYPQSHPLYSITRKNKLSFFKDETKSDKIKKIVALRSKCYSFTTKNNIYQIKCKGVTKAYKKSLPFNAFISCLKRIRKHSVSQFHIRSRNHSITLDKSTRVGLSSYDCNRFILKCGIHTLPYGSYLCKNIFHDECTLLNEINSQM